MAGEDEFHDDNPPPPPPLPPVTPTKQAPHTLSTIKLPILKKDTNGQIQVLPPKTAEEILARERERKARTTLLMSIPEDHLAKFHKMTDAKDMWEAIKSKFGGNDGSKKMQKYILKQQLKANSVSNLARLHKFFDKNGRRPGKQEEPKALVTLDGDGVDWTGHAEDEQENFALMAHSNSGSNTKVTSCSKECEESYAKLKKLYDEQREQLGVASIEIQAYTQALKKFMKIDLDDKTNVLTYHKKLLAEAVKEKEELKTKLENFQSSSKGLSKLLNSQMSTRDKSGLGYGNQIHEGVLSYEKEVLESVFDSRSSDVEDSPVNDRFAKVEGMHAVPPLMTGIYMPSKSDFGIDESKFTYGPKQSKTSESDAKTSDTASCESNSSVETRTSVSNQTVKMNTSSTEFSQLNRDCDFHGEKLGLQVELNKQKGKATSQGENRPVWNNVQRLNHQNKFVPKAVLSKTGIFPVNTARQNLFSQAATTSTARKVNTAKPIVSEIKPKNNFYKSHSPIRRPFNRTTTPKANFLNQKVNTAEVKVVSAVRGKRETAVKPPADYNGGLVAFGGSKGYITGKDKIKTRKLDFEDVCFVKELQHFNLFSVSQMCDKKNKILFTDTEGLMLSSDFKLHDENQVLLRIPRQNNMYSFNLENIVPSRELKNRDIIEFCRSKGIKREYNNARTPQQNGVAERKNRTLIEAARTMLADSFLPNTFWAEAVSTACYVLNRVLVTKPQTKTPYELIIGKIPIISYIRPFGCYVTILNTIDHLGKFEGKSDERFLVGYSLNSKAFRVYNLETKRVEENLHIKFLENKPNVAGKGPNWLFDLDYLTDSMNYQLVRSENQANKHAGPQEANHNAGTEDNIVACDSEIEVESDQDYFVMPIWSSYTSTVKRTTTKNVGEEPNKHPDVQPVDKEDQVFLDELERLKRHEQDANDAVEALRKEFAQETEELVIQAGVAKASSTNIVNTASTLVCTASPYGGLSFTDLTNTNQDDSEIPALEEIYNNPTDGIFTNASYDDEGAMADFTNLETIEELLQFKIQKVWILVDLPYGKNAIGTKWVYRNKKDERGVVVRNKARLVAQGHRQEEGIDYDEVFTHVDRIEAIRIFLAFASYMGFIVYQMDIKSAFLYGKIDEEVYVSQPPGFTDPKYPKKNGYRRGTIDKTLFIKKDKNDIMLVKVYVDDIIFGSTKKSWCDEFETLMKSRFQMSSMVELTFFLGLQVKQKKDGIFISQDKYVAEILKKFDLVNVKTASTPIKTHKPLVKDEEASDVDVHLYRSMIDSLMYLTASRPDIMFAVCACSRFQVTPKTSYLSAVKRIFRYLKGKPKLGLWYPRVSSFDLEAYSDSDYAGANLDRKSTTGEVEYVVAANCYGQVLWIQNQMLDYGFNFMNTKIYIDNETDLLTKAFDVSRFQFLVVTIGMIKP
ncbi:putative ribonuclease H-like domain-containing protein [Tanacetum coccineum]